MIHEEMFTTGGWCRMTDVVARGLEGILGQLIGTGLARWLPFYASESLDRASLTSSSGLLPGGLLAQWGGGLVLLGYAALFAVAAVLITLKRDVT
jgi:ABC-2 type transport system permease protein